MDIDNLIAIDTHVHAEVSCCQPPDLFGKEFDDAADKYFGTVLRQAPQRGACRPYLLRLDRVEVPLQHAWPTERLNPPSVTTAVHVTLVLLACWIFFEFTRWSPMVGHLMAVERSIISLVSHSRSVG